MKRCANEICQERTTDELCKVCTKRECIRALDMSGTIYSVRYAFSGLFKYQFGVDEWKTNKIVYTAYCVVSGVGGVSTDIWENAAALIECRDVVIGSLWALKYPYDVSAAVNAIDKQLMEAHKIAPCVACAVPYGLKKSLCPACHTESKGRRAKPVDAYQMFGQPIAAVTRLPTMIARIVAQYTLRSDPRGINTVGPNEDR